MEETFGWAGKILRVDLTSGSITEEPTLPKYEKFVGGTGLAYKVMFDEVPPETGAFDPENKIIFAVGPLTGSEAPGATRTLVVAKSPHVYEERFPEKTLTTRSCFGGLFGPALKYAGYDAVAVSGKSAEPVYLWIHDGEAEIRDASKLWGIDALETTKKIREDLKDSDAQVAAMGQAGENLVRVARIVHRGRGDHGAGQGGFGAVMGSKKLKAIAVKGTTGIATMKLAKTEEFIDVCKDAVDILTIVNAGPPSGLWLPGVDPHATSLYQHWQRYDVGKALGPILASQYRVGRTGDCPLKCFDEIEVPGIGEGAMMCMQYYYAAVGKPGVETFRCNDLCNRYGIDLYELWVMIPWLVKLFREGTITEEEIGIPLSAYPEKEFVETLLRKIAFREDFGDTLAEGTARTAKKLGGRAAEMLQKEELADVLAVEPKDIIAWSSYGAHGFCGHYDPRDWVVDGLFWTMSSRDPHDNTHNYIALVMWSGLPFEIQQPIAEKVYGSKDGVHPLGQPRYSEAEAQAAIIAEHRTCLKDMLTLCDWCWPPLAGPYKERTPPFMGDTSLDSRLFSTATGIDKTEDEMYKTAERVYNLMRAVLIREMGTRSMREDHDVLSEHYFINNGPKFGTPPLDKEKFDALKRKYYKLRGWSEDGLLTRSKLEELDLKDVADDLEKRGLLG